MIHGIVFVVCGKTTYQRHCAVDERILENTHPYKPFGRTIHVNLTMDDGGRLQQTLTCRVVSPRSTGKYKFAPLIKLWSSPDSSPPMDAKAMRLGKQACN
jgi:hypothetical protein